MRMLLSGSFLGKLRDPHCLYWVLLVCGWWWSVSLSCSNKLSKTVGLTLRPELSQLDLLDARAQRKERIGELWIACDDPRVQLREHLSAC